MWVILIGTAAYGGEVPFETLAQGARPDGAVEESVLRTNLGIDRAGLGSYLPDDRSLWPQFHREMLLLVQRPAGEAASLTVITIDRLPRPEALGSADPSDPPPGPSGRQPTHELHVTVRRDPAPSGGAAASPGAVFHLVKLPLYPADPLRVLYVDAANRPEDAAAEQATPRALLVTVEGRAGDLRVRPVCRSGGANAVAGWASGLASALESVGPAASLLEGAIGAQVRVVARPDAGRSLDGPLRIEAVRGWVARPSEWRGGRAPPGLLLERTPLWLIGPARSDGFVPALQRTGERGRVPLADLKFAAPDDATPASPDSDQATQGMHDRLDERLAPPRNRVLAGLIGANLDGFGEDSAILSDFEDEVAQLEGWEVFTREGDAGDIGDPRWESEGGNPGGYFAVEDNAKGGVIYYSAPGRFLGGRSASAGLLLGYDVSSTTTSSAFARDDVVLEGGGKRLLYRHTPPPAPSGWESFIVPLEPADGWRVMDAADEWDGSNGADLEDVPTAADFATVLGDLTALFIRGEYWTGSSSLGLDNVVLPFCSQAGSCTGASPDSKDRARRWTFKIERAPRE